MTDIFTIGLKADSSDIERGAGTLDKLADSASRAERGAAALREGVNVAGRAIATFGATATAALGAVTLAASETAQEITVLAQRSNLTTEEFQRTAFAARSVSVDMQGLSDIYQDFSDRVGDFLTTGGGPMLDFFETIGPKVGVTADQFRGLSGRDALQLYVSSLEKANLSQSEMVFFMEAMSSESTRLLPLLANNGEEFLRLSERADELGLVLDNIDVTNLREMRTALGEATSISTALSNVVGATLAPYVTDLTQRFNDNAVAADTVRDVMHDLVGVGVNVAGVYADAGRVFEITGRSIGAYAFEVTEQFSTIEQRLDLAYTKYQVFARNFDLATATWVNDFVDVTTEGFEDALNSIVNFLNNSIASFNSSGLGNILDKVGVKIKEISDFELEAPQIDTAELQQYVDYWVQEQNRLEGELTQSNEHIKDAWQDVLDLMAQPLPSEAFDDWFANISKAIKEQRTLQEETKKTGSTAVTVAGETTKAEREFSAERAESEISDLRAVTQTAMQAFGERSSAREALVRADQAFTAIELALSFKRSAANALEAISSAFAAPFPLNFAAGAAMIGIMAGLGLFSGGGGGADPTAGRQENQGTGTTLGDSGAKSESITRSADRLEDIQVGQLAELQGIRSGVNNLSNGIEGLARGLVAGRAFSGDGFNAPGASNSFGTGSSALGAGAAGGALALATGGAALLSGGLSIVATGILDKITGGLVSDVLSSIFGKTKSKIVDTGIEFFSQTLGEIFASGEVEAAIFADIETTTKRLFGLSKSTRTSREYQELEAGFAQQIGDIFGFIGDTVIDAADSLGFTTVEVIQTNFANLTEEFRYFDLLPREVVERLLGGTTETLELGLEEALARFRIDLPEISLEGLSGEEIQAELEAVFSQQADLIAEYLVPSIAEYQQIGEGTFETLVRVAQEQAIFNDALSIMGLSLSNLSNIMQIDIAQGIIDIVGGAEQFSSLVNNFVSEFLSEEEQFTLLTQNLTEALEGLGLSMFDSREQFVSLIQGLDLTTEEGQALFAALMQLNPILDQFFDQLEDNEADAAAEAERLLAEERRAAAEAAREAAQLEQERNSLNIRLLELQGNEEEALALRRARILADLDESLRALQQEIFDLEDAQRAAAEAARQAAEAQREYEQTLAGLEGALRDSFASIEREVRRQQSVLEAELRDTLSSVADQYDEQREAVSDSLAAALTDIESNYSNQRRSIEETSRALQDAAEGGLRRLSDSVRELQRELQDSLRDRLAEISSDLNVQSAEIAETLRSTLTDIEGTYAAQRAEINQRSADVESAARSSLSKLADAVGTFQREIQATLSETLESIAVDFASRREAIEAQSAEAMQNADRAFELLSDSIGRAQDEARDRLDSELQSIQDRFDRERQSIEDTLASRVESLDAQSGIIDRRVRALAELSDGLAQTIEEVRGSTREQALAEIRAAVSIANEGGDLSLLDLADAIAKASAIDPNEFGSLLSLQAEQAKTVNALSELENLTGEQLSEAEQNALLLQRQINAVRESADRQIEAANLAQQLEEQEAQARFDATQAQLEAQLQSARERLDALKGIDNRVLGLTEATSLFEGSVANLADNLQTAPAALEEVNRLEQEAIDAAQAQHDEAMAQSQAQLDAAQAQLNALLGVDDRVLSLAEAQAEFNANIAEFGDDLSISDDALEEVNRLEQDAIDAAQAQHDEALQQAQDLAEQARAEAQEQFDAQYNAAQDQLDLATQQLNALLGIDDRQLTVEEAQAAFDAALAAFGEDQTTRDTRLDQIIENEAAAIENENRIAAELIEDANRRQAEEEAQAQAHFDEQYGALQHQLDTAQDQLNAILGIDDRVLTLAELFELFNANLEALSTFLEESLAEEETPDTGPAEPPFTWEPVIQLPPIEIEWPKDPITIPIVPDPIEVDGLVTALDNLRASVQLLEAATITATTVTSGGDVSTGGGDVAVSSSDANFNNNEVLTAIALNTAKTAKLLGRWDGDGLPETRSVI